MISQIKEAVEVLKAGGIILYPTDTIWGLGCDATNEKAVAKIFEIKKRADAKSLVTLAYDMDMICKYVKEIPTMAVTLEEINDKPLTIIYPEGIGLAPNVTAKDGSIAIRIPRHEFCTQLIRQFRKPIVSTSANISGEPSPTHFKDIPAEILQSADWTADPIYEEGSTHQPSSIIKLGLHNEVEILRS